MLFSQIIIGVNVLVSVSGVRVCVRASYDLRPKNKPQITTQTVFTCTILKVLFMNHLIDIKMSGEG
jgi:hypothetical protein